MPWWQQRVYLEGLEAEGKVQRSDQASAPDVDITETSDIGLAKLGFSVVH